MSASAPAPLTISGGAQLTDLGSPSRSKQFDFSHAGAMHSELTSPSDMRRNFCSRDLIKDGMFDWIRDLLLHSFVLNAGQESYFDTFKYLEALIEEHRANPQRSRLLQYVPSVGRFFTPLPLSQAFLLYDRKYAISARRHVSPSFNEIRHIMNLSQVNAIGRTLSFISFDGDQTLYSDGGNFADDNIELADAIISLMRAGVIAACVTAAGYGYDGPRYETRLSGLLKRFVAKGLSAEEVSRFYVCGGECNYLMQCSLVPTSEAGGASSSSSAAPAAATAFAARLLPVPVEKWQAEALGGPRPFYWPAAEVTQILDVAEATLRTALVDLRLRAKILRKERAIGLYPGGDALSAAVPNGHGSKKLKREALDECVLRVAEALTMARPPITLPYCVFNGGRDAWIDVGNKSVGVRALQKFLALEPARCLHVGDQFLRTGNDLAARETCPCIWINSPTETSKVLQHVLYAMGLDEVADEDEASYVFRTSSARPYGEGALGLGASNAVHISSAASASEPPSPSHAGGKNA